MSVKNVEMATKKLS